MNNTIILQLLINGLMLGGLYSLIAVSLSLTFGIMRIVNFAHGVFLTIPMYLLYLLFSHFGVDPYLSVFIVAPFCFILGYLIQGNLIEPIFRRNPPEIREPMEALLITAGLNVFFANILLAAFSMTPREVQTSYSCKVIHFAGTVINLPRLITLAAVIVIFILLKTAFSKTLIGKAMRATALDREAALVSGINVYKIYKIAFGISLAILGVVAVLIVPYLGINPLIGDKFTTKAFIIVVLGGIGSLDGAFYAAFIVGVIEVLAGYFIGSMTTEILIFLTFVTVLIFRPTGLLGKE